MGHIVGRSVQLLLFCRGQSVNVPNQIARPTLPNSRVKVLAPRRTTHCRHIRKIKPPSPFNLEQVAVIGQLGLGSARMDQGVAAPVAAILDGMQLLDHRYERRHARAGTNQQDTHRRIGSLGERERAGDAVVVKHLTAGLFGHPKQRFVQPPRQAVHAVLAPHEEFEPTVLSGVRRGRSDRVGMRNWTDRLSTPRVTLRLIDRLAVLSGAQFPR